MSVILQRGDRIHLAVPISAASQHEAETETRKAIAALEPDYTQQGVTIISWSANTLLTHPVVVAVFRDSPGGER